MTKLVLTISIFVLMAVLLILPVSSFAQDCPPGSPEGTVCLKNPLRVNTPGEFVVQALQGFAGLIGMIAIAFTVFSGFKLVIATNEEAINNAKSSLTWSMLGFVVAISTFTIISGTANFLGFAPSEVGLAEDTLRSPLVGPGDPTDFVSVMNFLMINFLGLVGVATTLMIIYYGYRYITAAGNEEMIEKAKSELKWAIIGLVVTLLAFTIITSARQLLIHGV